MLEGVVRADNPAQRSGADLPQGTGAVINPAQREVTVVKLLPAPDLGALPAEITAAQAHSWPLPVLPGAVAFRLQVASDSGFERIVRDQRIAGATADLSGLVLGIWHVRLRGIDAQTLEGFDSAKPLTIKADQRAWRVINSSLSLVDGTARLNWTGMRADGEPIPLVGATATLAADAERGAFGLGALQPGRYYLRIDLDGKAEPRSSEVYRLDVPEGWGRNVVNVMTALQPAGA